MTGMSAYRDWLAERPPTSAMQARAQNWMRGAAIFARNRLAMAGAAIVALLVASALFAPWIAPYPPDAIAFAERLRPPSASHWFGTDELGRDIFSRIIHGTRITLYVVALVVLVVGTIGTTIGIAAGYFGGWLDLVLMRIADIFLAFPGLILALAFVAVLGPGLGNAILAISLTSWPQLARLARAETLTIRNREFISAIRVQGASHARIVFRHILPLCLSTVVVRLTLYISGIILTTAGLGFLGLGAQPPSPEWGAMLASGRQFMLLHWWLAAMPGLAILVTTIGFSLFGDGLRDILDPRQGAS